MKIRQITEKFTGRRRTHHENTLKKKKGEHNLTALGTVLFAALAAAR